MTRSPLQIALVGCGAISQFAHVPALTMLTAACRVVAVVDKVGERRDLVGASVGVPDTHRYGDVEAMLSFGPAVDLAVVAVPPTQAGSVVGRLLGAGLSVLTEKPFTGDAADARKISRSDARDRFGVIHNYLYRSDVTRARNLLTSGEVGAPRIVRLERLDPDHFHGKGINPHWRRLELGGGCLIDNGYHWIYLAQALAGSPIVSVVAELSPNHSNTHSMDVALLTLRHANGVPTSIQVAWCAVAASPVLEVHGERASLRLLGDGKSCLLVTSAGPSLEAPTACAESSYVHLYREVFDSISAGVQFGASAEQCAAVHDIIDAAIHSARMGRRVRVRSSDSALETNAELRTEVNSR